MTQAKSIPGTQSVPWAHYAAQAEIAHQTLLDYIALKRREGYVETFPGHFELRGDNGVLVACFDVG